jgi:hypothetical protein
MEGERVVWNPNQQHQLKILGFNYDDIRDRWVKTEKDHDELVWATADYLYWFDTENYNGGRIIGNNKFPIMDFDALIIFLKALKSIKELSK